MEVSTLKQIAEELNISISTVSRAINGKTVVKDETRRRVLELAEKYSYVPNEIARSLQKSCTKTIAVVLPDISETFFGIIVNALDKVVSQYGYMLILADTHESVEKEHQLVQMLYTRRVDAMVIATVSLDGGTVQNFLDTDFPVVFIDNIPNIDGLEAVTIDNRMASRLAVEHLLAYGHKHIAAIFGSQQETTGYERLAGYQDTLCANGIETDEALIAYGDYKRESGYLAMKELLSHRGEKFFTAVYITSEKMTYGALTAIRESGLRVPEDISVIGFDIHPAEDSQQQRITSIRQPEEMIGQLVGMRLLQSLGVVGSEENIPSEPTPVLVEGDTVCFA